jgi:hypothetical protein
MWRRIEWRHGSEEHPGRRGPYGRDRFGAKRTSSSEVGRVRAKWDEFERSSCTSCASGVMPDTVSGSQSLYGPSPPSLSAPMPAIGGSTTALLSRTLTGTSRPRRNSSRHHEADVIMTILPVLPVNPALVYSSHSSSSAHEVAVAEAAQSSVVTVVVEVTVTMDGVSRASRPLPPSPIPPGGGVGVARPRTARSRCCLSALKPGGGSARLSSERLREDESRSAPEPSCFPILVSGCVRAGIGRCAAHPIRCGLTFTTAPMPPHYWSSRQC